MGEPRVQNDRIVVIKERTNVIKERTNCTVPGNGLRFGFDDGREQAAHNGKCRLGFDDSTCGSNITTPHRG
jgi:hypothetical protein